MEVNVQKQCVKVFTAEGVINMQPLVVLTQDLSGVAQESTLTQGISDIRGDISTLAKQGDNENANLSSTQTAAQGAALNSQIARGYIGTPESGRPDTLFKAIANINIDTSTIAQRTDVKDGNDTAISVAKEIRSEVGTGSDTAAESGTLFAILKWVKDKVKSIFNLIGSPASGQPSTLFAAIAAGGGGGGETPSEVVDDSVSSKALDPNKVYIFTNRTSNLAITLNAGEAGVANEYHFFIEVGSSLPTITFPNTITWVNTLTMSVNSNVEISILNDYAVWM